jgi:hypothetical protein
LFDAPPAEFVKSPRRPVTIHLPLLTPGKAKQGRQRADDAAVAAAGSTLGSEPASPGSTTPGSDKKKGNIFSRMRWVACLLCLLCLLHLLGALCLCSLFLFA